MAEEQGSAVPWLSWAWVAISVVLTVGVLLAVTPQAEQRLQQARVYAIAHPLERIPVGCEALVSDTTWTALAIRASTTEFDRLCTEARDAADVAGARRAALVPPDSTAVQSPWAWLLHPLIFANPLVAVLAWLLTAVALGPFAESSWGRKRTAVLVVVASLVAALTWRTACTVGAVPWTGGQAWLAALVAAIVLRWPAEPIPLHLPPAWLRGQQVYVWQVAAAWASLRLLAMLWGDAGRAALLAEFMGLSVGIGWAVMDRAGAIERIASGAWLDALRTARRTPASAADGEEERTQAVVAAPSTVDTAVAADAPPPEVYDESDPEPPAAPGQWDAGPVAVDMAPQVPPAHAAVQRGDPAKAGLGWLLDTPLKAAPPPTVEPDRAVGRTDPDGAR